jgi:hypothetical protein
VRGERREARGEKARGERREARGKRRASGSVKIVDALSMLLMLYQCSINATTLPLLCLNRTHVGKTVLTYRVDVCIRWLSIEERNREVRNQVERVG